jgi:hypothetical protein
MGAPSLAVYVTLASERLGRHIQIIVRRTLAHVNVISYEDTTETEERCAA